MSTPINRRVLSDEDAANRRPSARAEENAQVYAAMNPVPYRIDRDMCGAELAGDVAEVAAYLTEHGYPAVAVASATTRAWEGEGAIEPPEHVWLAALVYADAQAEGK